MEKWFKKEAEIEYWMQPFTALLMVPGGKRVMRTNTRLFFDLYWKLLKLGYTETQITEHVTEIRWGSTPALDELTAFVHAVFGLAAHKGVAPSAEFIPYFGKDHPRHIIDRFK